jgi:hypothetical protein
MTTTTIPCYPIQQSHHPSMYYSPYHHPPQYYYPQSSDVNNFYYNPPTIYSNSQQMYSYGGHPTPYYHPPTTYNNNEQLNYYYSQQQQPSYSYSSQTNSTNDIPLANNPSLHRTYQPINMNMQRYETSSKKKRAINLDSSLSSIHCVSYDDLGEIGLRAFLVTN